MTIHRRSLLLAAVAVAPFSARASQGPLPGKPRPKFGEFGLDLAGMDRSVAPGDDFYRYMNGQWLKANSVPPDRASWSAQAGLLDLNRQRVRDLLLAAATSTEPTERKLADYYTTVLDEVAIERLGMAPVRHDLDRVAAISTPADLARMLARFSLFGDAPINHGVSVDLKEPERYTAGLSQGGLGMPDRDYYLVDRPNYVAAREAYRKHLAGMLALAGLSEPEAKAERVYDLELRLAQSHRSREANRDQERRYNLRTPAQLATEAPGLDWPAFLEAAGFAGQDRINVAQPEAITGASAAAGSVPLDDWRAYLAVNVLRSFAPVGPKAIYNENFDFQSRTLSGVQQPLDRWKRAVTLTEGAMGQATSQLYLKAYFPPEARAEAEAMAANILAAMGRHIRALPWMTPKTKARALAKLGSVRVEVGGEVKPRDFSGLVVAPGDAWGNLGRAVAFEHRRQIAKLGKPVDHGEWFMTAQTVNAQSYNSMSKIMIAAGYLQPPLFDLGADRAVNYGGIGRTIGHELSHQFDDQGAKFDERGAMNNWWEPQDLVQFKAAGEALAGQYDAFEPLPGLHINGRLTLGENIGDVAGLSLSYDAYKASLNGKPAPVLGGFTGDQRFYLSHAQVWRILQRETDLRRTIATDPHSPGEWRAAQVRNLDPWYAAFNVTPAGKQYLPPAQRVRVW